MKKLLLTLTVAASLLGCKKETQTSNIEYLIHCENCIAKIETENGFKEMTVAKDSTILDTNHLSKLTVITEGNSDSEVKIIINGKVAYKEIKSMCMNGGKAVHTLDVVH